MVLSIDTSSGDGRVAFQSVSCCKNDDYKNGNAADAWARLTAKYVPNIAPIKLELKSEFQHSKLWDATQGPDTWISDLESLRAQLKEIKLDILDEDFMIHVLNGLPAEYEVQISKLEV